MSSLASIVQFPTDLPERGFKCPAVARTAILLGANSTEWYQNGTHMRSQSVIHQLKGLYSDTTILKIMETATEHLLREVNTLQCHTVCKFQRLTVLTFDIEPVRDFPGNSASIRSRCWSVSILRCGVLDLRLLPRQSILLTGEISQVPPAFPHWRRRYLCQE